MRPPRQTIVGHARQHSSRDANLAVELRQALVQQAKAHGTTSTQQPNRRRSAAAPPCSAGTNPPSGLISTGSSRWPSSAGTSSDCAWPGVSDTSVDHPGVATRTVVVRLAAVQLHAHAARLAGGIDGKGDRRRHPSARPEARGLDVRVGVVEVGRRWPAKTAVATTGGRCRRRLQSTTRTGVTRMRAIDASKRSSARRPTKFASRSSVNVCVHEASGRRLPPPMSAAAGPRGRPAGRPCRQAPGQATAPWRSRTCPAGSASRMFNKTRSGCGARRRPGVASNCTIGGTSCRLRQAPRVEDDRHRARRAVVVVERGRLRASVQGRRGIDVRCRHGRADDQDGDRAGTR